MAAAVAAKLAESEPFRHVVNSVARGPEVRNAIQAQSTGLATELGDQMRERTARVDDALENAARRLVHRRAAGGPVVRVPFDGAR